MKRFDFKVTSWEFVQLYDEQEEADVFNRIKSGEITSSQDIFNIHPEASIAFKTEYNEPLLVRENMGAATIEVSEKSKIIFDNEDKNFESSQVEKALQTLKDNGYCVDYIWQVADVKNKFECTDDEAYEVLDKALQNDSVMDSIWFAIDFHGEDNGLKYKEED
jgi:hypothetical protein